MRLGDQYQCDICKETSLGKESVDDSVSIENGKYSGNYSQVCRKCIEKVGEVIDSLRPQKKEEIKNKWTNKY